MYFHEVMRTWHGRELDKKDRLLKNLQNLIYYKQILLINFIYHLKLWNVEIMCPDERQFLTIGLHRNNAVLVRNCWNTRINQHRRLFPIKHNNNAQIISLGNIRIEGKKAISCLAGMVTVKVMVPSLVYCIKRPYFLIVWGNYCVSRPAGTAPSIKLSGIKQTEKITSL